MCAAYGTKLPLLPVHGKEEKRVFSELILEQNGEADIDFDAMAIEWCKHVDGDSIMPKLPAYLRTYFSTWQRNQRVRDAVDRAAAGKEKLEKLLDVSGAMAVQKGAGAGAGAKPTAFNVQQHVSLQKPSATAAVPAELVVGGSNVGASALDEPSAKKFKKRGGDKAKRKPRTCRSCRRADCRGRASNVGPDGCEFK